MSSPFPIKPKFPVPQSSNMLQTADQTRADDAVTNAAKDGRAGFSAYADSMIGGAGFKASTKDNKAGFVVQSGPMRGKTKDQAMLDLRASYQNLTPEQKQRAIDRGTGADLAPDYKGGAMPSMQSGSGPGGGLRTGSIGGGGLDWLKQNRLTGDALRQAEKNVQATGDRNLSAPVKPPSEVVFGQQVPPSKIGPPISPGPFPVSPTPSVAALPARPIATPPAPAPALQSPPSADVPPEKPRPAAASMDFMRSTRADNLRTMPNGTPGSPLAPMGAADKSNLDSLVAKNKAAAASARGAEAASELDSMLKKFRPLR